MKHLSLGLIQGGAEDMPDTKDGSMVHPWVVEMLCGLELPYNVDSCRKLSFEFKESVEGAHDEDAAEYWKGFCKPCLRKIGVVQSG